jgi:hypothetical protein
MSQDPRKPDQKHDNEKQRTGPGSGAGRGNDLPSETDPQRDVRTAEGEDPGKSADRPVEREVATRPGTGNQNIDAVE